MVFQHRHHLVGELVSRAVHAGQADAELAARLFERVAERQVCSAESLEEGFGLVAGTVCGTMRGVPEAWERFAVMLRGACLSEMEWAQQFVDCVESDTLSA